MTKREKVQVWYKLMKRYSPFAPYKLTPTEISKYAQEFLSTPTIEWSSMTQHEITPPPIWLSIFSSEIISYKMHMVEILGQEAYNRFIENAKKQDACSILQKVYGKFTDDKFMSYLIIMRSFSKNIIDISIIWSHTPEGHEYWCNLNNKVLAEMPSRDFFLCE